MIRGRGINQKRQLKTGDTKNEKEKSDTKEIGPRETRG